MLLAGSIAATALPLTASAGIIGDITVYNGDTSKELNYANFHSDTLVSGNLNSNSLWGVYYNYSHHNSGEIIESGTIVESVSGDKLLGKIGDFDGRDLIDYSDVKISAQHKYIVTTEDPSTTSISIESVKTTSTFPLEISLSEYGFTASPLIDHYSCTAWYGVPELNSTIVSHSSLVESNVKSVTSSADSKEITVGMEAFAGLYSADIDTVAEDKAEYIFENGITILQLKSEYKTLSLPVKNALLRQETDSDGDDRHISVSKDSESLLDEGDYYFYLCYYDEVKESFKISSSATKYEKAVWDEINSWVTEDPNLDTNKLFLCRKVTVNVNGNGVDSEFYTTDLLDYQIVNQGNSTTNEALLALLNAKPNSIWEVNPRFTENPRFYIYQKDAATSISDFLLEYPHEKRLNLFEQSSIRVTALAPKTNGEIEWGSFIESKLLDENGEPRKISDHFNDLFTAVPQEAGKKYDTDGWQLWAGVTSCGGLYDFSKVELDKKPDSIGVTELNKRQNSIAFVYFPQVQIAPSLEVTAPVAGETPSTECKILDKLGGYSVDGVEWDCDYTLLVANDKFEAGKEYTVEIVLRPDEGLSFTDDTPVTINGEKADIKYEKDTGVFYARYTFPALPAAAVAGHSLVLADSIGVKFYMELADDLLSDDTAKMTFTANGKQTIIPVSEGQRATLNDKTVYAFTCYVAAAEMTDRITAQITAADYSSEEFTYNVQTYAKYILDNPAAYTKYVPVVKAMLNYGAEAQKYFKHNTETLSNNILDEGDKTTDPVTLPELKSYNYTCSDRDADIDFAGYTISLKSRITAKLYFEGADLTKDKITVLAGKQEVDLNRLTIGSDSNGTYLAISDINAGDFDQSFTISVGGITIDKFSVYSYLYQCLKKDRTDLKNIVNTLYAYNEAVKEII